jgi:hypothetical protein
MVLRVLEYLVQIYKGQVHDKKKGRRTDDGFRLRPVLPIVFYTRERRWEALTPFAELVAGGAEDFADVLPQLRPLFLNLSAIAPAELERSGGAFGWVLELIRARHAPRDEFHTTAARVADHLVGMAEIERERYLVLLSYIDAMIYHDRAEEEREELRELILQSIHSDPVRKEVEAMMRTGAQVLHEQGRKKGREEGELHSRQQVLVRLLRQRFGRVPRVVEQVIRATNDIARLDAWLDNFATAQSLVDVGIPTGPQ